MGIIATLTPKLDPSSLVLKKIVFKESLIQIGRIKKKDHGKQETTVTNEVSKSEKTSFVKKIILLRFSRVLIGF